MKRFLVVSVFLLLVVSVFLFRGYRRERGERQRGERNVAALCSDVERYRTERGGMAAKIAGLELSVRDLERLQPELYGEISDLRVKLKHALSVTQVRTEFVYVNRDSIVYADGGDSLRRFEVADEWIRARVTVRGCRVVPAGGFEILGIPNELTAVAEVRYRGWWFWRRAVSLDLHVKNSNPYVGTADGIFVDLKGVK